MSTTADVLEIPAQSGLDPITVYFHDVGSGKGSMTVICYGCAWTSYWGAMGDRTVLQFVVSCDADYLFRNLAYAQHLKQGRNHLAYLKRIVEAVKNHLKRLADERVLSLPSEYVSW